MTKASFYLKVIIILIVLTISTNAFAQKKGDMAPNFKGVDLLTGQEYDYYKDLKGKKVVLLDFWSIFCVSCIQEIYSAFNPLALKFEGKDVIFLGINMDSSSKRVKKFLKAKPINYPTIMDRTREIYQSYGVSILPTTIIIDKKGKIRFRHEGYKRGDEKLMKKVLRKLSK